MKPSDPYTPDRARYGDDLLRRIDELTVGKDLGVDGNGWRNLLLACGAEIGRLRADLRGIAHHIDINELTRR